MFQGLHSISWRKSGALNQPLVEIQGMHSLEIERQTNQTPFSGRSPQAAQGELAEPQDFLDDPNNGFDRAFAHPIDRLSDLRLQLVSHLLFRAGFLARRVWQFG